MYTITYIDTINLQVSDAASMAKWYGVALVRQRSGAYQQPDFEPPWKQLFCFWVVSIRGCIFRALTSNLLGSNYFAFGLCRLEDVCEKTLF